MAIATPDSITCTNCGALRESTTSDDLGCMICLLHLGLETKPSRSDVLPSAFASYVIERHEHGELWELGRGAMGVTYRAIDKSLQRPVALKIVKADFAARGAEARERFIREARAAGALRHPNVAIAYQFGIDEDTGRSFYAMELVEGETLEARVRRCGPLPVSTVVEIAQQITAALGAAEKRGLVHRDLKPANIMIASGERKDELIVKVIDFGLAKALAEVPDARTLTCGGFVGTPAFASPEQLNAKAVDTRSDIYSLGATLWYLLTGHTLFHDRTGTASPPIEQLKAAHVPRRLMALLLSMLATEPAARPNVNALAERLKQIEGGLETRRRPIVMALTAMVVAALIITYLWSSLRRTPTPALPEKSIAVLPFTSFGDDKENAYLADGVQDEILTDLTKVADLKVIGRRSVMQYRDTKRSVQEIGQALQVSNVLEGTVRKVTGRIHVTVQLIDARTGTQHWAEKYERELSDISLIQSDIAQEVVSRLKAELSPREKEAIEEKPTEDSEAYNLYLRARSLGYEQDGKVGKQAEDDANGAIQLLEQAITRDPKFTMAYCVLADAHLTINDLAQGWGERSQEKAKQAIDTALQISPGSAEAHLLRARYFIECLEDIPAGEKDLGIAAAALPGRVTVFELRGDVEEHRGQWKEALRDRERALELDPHHPAAAFILGHLYITLRRYSQADRLVDHMIAVLPKDAVARFWRLKSNLALARGDTRGAMAALDSSPTRQVGLLLLNELVANLHITERNYSKAEEFFQSIVQPTKMPYLVPSAGREGLDLFWRGQALERLGRLARLRGEKEKARSFFEAARPNFEQWLANDSGHNSWRRAHAPPYIAEIDAALGRKDEAIREGRKAVEEWPLQRDARIAPDMKIYLAIVYLWSGNRDAALQQLSETAKLPVWPSLYAICPGLSAGELRLNPLWDELRSDPRFDQVVREAAKPISF